MNILVFDSETYGLDPHNHSLLELGACVWDLDNEKVLADYSTLIKYPSIKSYQGTEEALKVNGLSISDCFDQGKEIEEVQDDFMSLFSSYSCKALGGHNIFFDIGFISHQLFQTDPVSFYRMIGCTRVIDTFAIFTMIEGHDDLKGGLSLNKLISALKIPTKDIKVRADGQAYHSALFDAICSAKLISHLQKRLLTLSYKT